MKIDPATIDSATRLKMLERALEKGFKARDLGVSKSTVKAIRSGRFGVSDRLARRLLELLSPDDLLTINRELFSRYVDSGDEAVERSLISYLRGVAQRHPAAVYSAIKTVMIELEKMGFGQKSYRVDDGLIDEFRRFLEARVVEGRMSRETAGDRMRYLRRLLSMTGGVFSARRVNDVLRDESLNGSPFAAEHMYKAAKLFARHVLNDRELYLSIDRVSPRYSEPEAPSIEEVRLVHRALRERASRDESYVPALTLFSILAESGMRVEAAYSLSLASIDLAERVIRINRVSGTKRAYFTFISEGTASYIASRHIPYLESRKLIGRGKLFPVKPRILRLRIYEAMDEALGYRFELKLLRKRFAEHMSRYLSALELNIIMGHAPRSVVEKHYLLRDNVISLREKYDKAIYRLW